VAKKTGPGLQIAHKDNKSPMIIKSLYRYKETKKRHLSSQKYLDRTRITFELTQRKSVDD